MWKVLAAHAGGRRFTVRVNPDHAIEPRGDVDDGSRPDR